MWGAFNGNWGLQPVGGTTAVAWVAGVKYTIPQLPMTLGTYYFNYKNQGAGPAARVSDSGPSRGWMWARSMALARARCSLAEYTWGQKYQGGYDFLTGASDTTAGNKVQAQIATLGMSIRF